MFTLTARRGNEAVSKSLTIAAIDGIAANWALLDSFDLYDVGPLPRKWWNDVRGNSQIVNVNSNRMLDMQGIDRIAMLDLGNLTVKQGEQRTLFTRIHLKGDPAIWVRSRLGLTDRSLPSFFGNSGGAGPAASISNQQGGLMVGAHSGADVTDFLPPILETGQTYNLWLDVKNEPAETDDIFTVWLQKEGETTRTKLFENYLSDRAPWGDPAGAGGTPTLPDLNRVYLMNQATNSVFFDDLYISKLGYNPTVPRPLGSTVAPSPPTTGGDGETLKVSIGRSGAQLEIKWTQGTLERAPSVAGPWSAAQGAAAPSYKMTPDATRRFFRIRK